MTNTGNDTGALHMTRPVPTLVAMGVRMVLRQWEHDVRMAQYLAGLDDETSSETPDILARRQAGPAPSAVGET